MAEQTRETDAELIQKMREQRLMTLALVDQISMERWDEPALPGGASLHSTFAHLLGWDEWATAVFELSALRPLPERLVNVYRDVDGFNARSISRFKGIDRDDLLASLQGSSMRLVSSALAVGGAEWAQRRVPELAPPPADGAHSEKPSRGPSIGGILRMLRRHEREHCEELSATYSVTVDMEQLRQTLTGEAQVAGEANKGANRPAIPRATAQPQAPGEA